MKYYGKKTVLLILASAITAAGAFGAENYKNSLMALKFENLDDGAVSMLVLTKRDYQNTLNLVKKDASTYVIMLSETDSKLLKNPTVSGDIESIDIRTMPYTSNSKGYTKITLKTYPGAKISAQKALFTSEHSEFTQEHPWVPETDLRPSEIPGREERLAVQPKRNMSSERTAQTANRVPKTSDKIQNTQDNSDISENDETAEHSNEEAAISESDNTGGSSLPPVQDGNSSFEIVLFLLAFILIAAVSTYSVLHAKERIAVLTGESPDNTALKEKKKKSENRKKKSFGMIQNVDKKYAKPLKMPSAPQSTAVPKDIADFGTPAIQEVSAPPKDVPVIEERAADLGSVLPQNTNQEDAVSEEEENAALADFLDAFGFEEEDIQEPENLEEEAEFDDEFYQRCISNDSLKFTGEDIEKINELLNYEISSETLENISKICESKNAPPQASKQELLENHLVSYMVNEHIVFSREDVEVLNKLVNAELSEEFTENLKYDPEYIAMKQKELEEQRQLERKKAETKVLNVKDLLPDLESALKQQNGRRIESEWQPQTVCYDARYDVSTLKTDTVLPDLSKEINNSSAYKTQASYNTAYALSGYDVPKMDVSGMLPDLSKALAKELNTLNESFEIVYESEESLSAGRNFKNDNSEFSDGNKYTDLDKNEYKKHADTNTPKLSDLTGDKNSRTEEKSAEKQTEEKRAGKEAEKELEEEIRKPKEIIESPIADDAEYTVLDTSYFNDGMGCRLVKSNDGGYDVIGFAGSKTFKIKHYETLKTEKLNSRLSEMFGNNSRYIIKAGGNKFLINVSGDDMKYEMDLS